jgi:hypothetical protein
MSDRFTLVRGAFGTPAVYDTQRKRVLVVMPFDMDLPEPLRNEAATRIAELCLWAVNRARNDVLAKLDGRTS